MKAKVNIDAGVCGFHTRVIATCQDGQFVKFNIETDCDTIRNLADVIKEKDMVDSFAEISPANESVILTTAQSTLKGCCAGCAVPVGLFKAMQVAANLALPKDINIKITKEN
jgi:hypothetical protein